MTRYEIHFTSYQPFGATFGKSTRNFFAHDRGDVRAQIARHIKSHLDRGTATIVAWEFGEEVAVDPQMELKRLDGELFQMELAREAQKCKMRYSDLFS